MKAFPVLKFLWIQQSNSCNNKYMFFYDIFQLNSFLKIFDCCFVSWLCVVIVCTEKCLSLFPQNKIFLTSMLSFVFFFSIPNIPTAHSICRWRTMLYHRPFLLFVLHSHVVHIIQHTNWTKIFSVYICFFFYFFFSKGKSYFLWLFFSFEYKTPSFQHWNTLFIALSYFVDKMRKSRETMLIACTNRYNNSKDIEKQ